MSAGETVECSFSRFVFEQKLRMTWEEYDDIIFLMYIYGGKHGSSI